MRAIGLDIGGANVKAADSFGRAITRPFAIWREPERLEEVLREVLDGFDDDRVDVLAVTTTAELADCFRTKAEGVDRVLAACEAVAEGRPVAVWQTGAEFVPPAVARGISFLVAAANWHALATWLGRLVPHGRTLLVDIGSTTTDLVPLLEGVPIPVGLTDVARLVSGELVYTGVRRTPVFAVADEVPLGEGICPLVPELFATMHDVYLLTGDVPEDPDDTDTANGRPATRAEACARLARAVCGDRNELGDEMLDRIATHLAAAHVEQLRRAIDRCSTGVDSTLDDIEQVLVSGSGSFLADCALDLSSLAEVPRTRVDRMFDAATASAACARAVAELAIERRADLLG